jgi:uncharacterized membrane protein
MHAQKYIFILPQQRRIVNKMRQSKQKRPVEVTTGRLF